jgi:opacity protein-like surface antigen
VDAVYSQAPFLANLRFQVPYRWVVTPYIGGGLGGSISTLDADHIDLNGTHFEGWMSDVVFAYQAFGGLRFRINDAMGVSVEYRYFVAEAPSWQADVTVNTDSQHVRFGGTESHVVSIAFDWRF